MSKTDKTDPAWIQAIWEDGWVAEHECNVAYGREDCDLPPAPPKHYDRTPSRFRRGREHHCRWEPQMVGRYSYTLRYYRNASRGVAYVANQMERGIRARWRVAQQELLREPHCCEYQRGCYCNLDDIELPDPRHRHFALWDRW